MRISCRLMRRQARSHAAAHGLTGDYFHVACVAMHERRVWLQTKTQKVAKTEMVKETVQVPTTEWVTETESKPVTRTKDVTETVRDVEMQCASC